MDLLVYVVEIIFVSTLTSLVCTRFGYTVCREMIDISKIIRCNKMFPNPPQIDMLKLKTSSRLQRFRQALLTRYHEDKRQNES